MCITWVNFHAPFEHTEKLALGVGVPVPPLQTQACLSQSVLKAPCRGMGWSPCWVTVERRTEQLKFKTSYPREWMEGEPSPTDTAVVYPTKEKCLQWEREARSSPVERKLNPNPLGLPRLPQLPPCMQWMPGLTVLCCLPCASICYSRCIRLLLPAPCLISSLIQNWKQSCQIILQPAQRVCEPKKITNC